MEMRNEMRLGLEPETLIATAEPISVGASLKPENAAVAVKGFHFIGVPSHVGFPLRRQITIAHGRAGPQSEHGESEIRATACPLTTRSSMRNNEYLICLRSGYQVRERGGRMPETTRGL
jgi:hypothetical protein